MRFTKWVFLLAGATGVVMIGPLYFLEERLGRDNPPPINHPEWYYGFVGVTLVWQFMYLLIGSDPVRYRPAMLAAGAAKGSYAVTLAFLFASDRLAPVMLPSAALDAFWVALFLTAFVRTGRMSRCQRSTTGTN
jgi:hypothetical protein